MNNKILLRLASSSSALIASFLVAILSLWMQSWFGVRDLYAFGFWTIPLLAIVFGLAPRLHTFFLKRSHIAANLLAFAFGFIAGFLWTLLVAIFLGPWFGTFSFPVIVCWIAGAIAGFCSIAGPINFNAYRRPILSVLISLILGVLFFFAYHPVGNVVRDDQELEVLKFSWQPGDSLRFEYMIIGDERVNESDSTALAKAGVRGTLTLVGIAIHGSGPRAKAIIVLRQPVKSTITLQQPDRSTIAYVQTEQNSFRVYPPDAKTLQRVIELSPSSGHSGTDIMVELASGAMQGGSFEGSINVRVMP